MTNACTLPWVDWFSLMIGACGAGTIAIAIAQHKADQHRRRAERRRHRT